VRDDQRERFELLYREHAPALLAYALRRADTEMAQDAVAEVFVVAWRRFDSLPEEPLPWLYGIARRTLANQRRGQRRRDLLHLRIASNERRLHDDGGDGRVLAALATLGRSDQELLMLVAWEGLTPTQAATALGCSANACRIRLHRARLKLERALEPSGRAGRATVKPREGL
jgi:RNA polymerase sigma-70 factor (ECF subfamily)